MNISNARWADAAETMILAIVDGAETVLQAPPPAGVPVADYEAPAPTAGDVERERDRRLSLGFDYDFEDERGVHHIGTDPKDMRAWMDYVMPLATARVEAGVTTPIAIKTNTGTCEVAPAEFLAVIRAGSAVHQPVWQGYFYLKGLETIPDDYASNESYWTA